jgi:hypothetical protein
MIPPPNHTPQIHFSNSVYSLYRGGGGASMSPAEQIFTPGGGKNGADENTGAA